MALSDGDVIRFDYTLRVDGKVADSSDEAVAKEHGIHRDSRRYRPLTVTLGGRQIIPGLESHIRSHGQVGKQVSVEIAAKDAYGEREAGKIRDIPMAQFRKEKVQPQVGMSLQLGNERGVVTRVAGGRVRVDLNHDLAGKNLHYDYTVREVLTDEKSKVDAVLESMFGPGAAKATVGKDAVVLEVPDSVKFDEQWMMAKFTVVSRLREATGRHKAIHLVEIFPVLPEPKAEMADEPGHEGHGHGPGEHKH